MRVRVPLPAQLFRLGTSPISLRAPRKSTSRGEGHPDPLVSVEGEAYDRRRDPKEADMRIEVRGRNVEITDELRGHVIKRFRRVGRQVSELGDARCRDLRGEKPLDPRQPSRRSHPPLEGRDPAGKRSFPRDGPHDPSPRRRHPPPGKEAPRATPQANPNAPRRRSPQAPVGCVGGPSGKSRECTSMASWEDRLLGVSESKPN